MGTIAHRFETGEQAAQRGHFRNLILLARIDGKIDNDEKVLLQKMANRLSLTEQEVKEILDDENSYPMIPPVTIEERYERFIQFVQMIHTDGHINQMEDSMVHMFAIALGFTQETVDEKYPIILEKVEQGIAREEILESIL